MNTRFELSTDQLTLRQLIWYHFYMGILITACYIPISKIFSAAGFPGFTSLLIVELFILTPVGLAHLYNKGYQLLGKYSLKNVIVYTQRLSLWEYVKWSLIGITACFLIYIPMYPIGIFMKEQVFFWLPSWYFDPSFGTIDVGTISMILLSGIVIDGLIAPTIEELFFRGYLLPRMASLRHWAPIVNGALFGLYHFWQPHNYFAIIGLGIVLSYIVQRKQNVYLGIIIHCSLNILGAIGAYLAFTNGIDIPR